MMDGTKDGRSAACLSGEELVSYLYGEMPGDERAVFETHLPDCDTCAAELAELSFARLDVYEWKRDEFVEMATPRITVPYAVKQRVSVFDALRGWFAFPTQLAAAGGLAVIGVVAGVWLMNPAGQEMVRSIAEPTPGPVNARTVETPAIPVEPTTGVRPSLPIPKTNDPERFADTSSEPVGIKPDSKPIPVKAAERSASPAKAAKTNPRDMPRRNAAPPRLNDFEDEDDNTLRLGDLMAEIDTKE